MILAEATVNVTAAVPLATRLLVGIFVAAVLWFALRPELWRRLVLERVDPRPAGVLRIAFGVVVLWTFVDLLAWKRLLFTDEGIYLTSGARKAYGGTLRELWDPEHGFEGPWGVVQALWSHGSILHLRSDPAFVDGLFAVTLVALSAMVLGVATRFTTVLAWLCVEQLYRYNPIFHAGGDTVTRAFLFLGVFCAWGEAYSVDSWWRRRRELLRGAAELPALRSIPAWPQRLMMLQLVCIYCATGFLKSGHTWADGTAMYYALNLDHFYRIPMTSQVAWAQRLGFLPVMTWVVHWWEMLFPLALVGAWLQRFERERAAGTWPVIVGWRRWAGHAVLAGALLCGAGLLALVGFYYLPLLSSLDAPVLAALAGVGGVVVPLGCVLGWRFVRRRWPAGTAAALPWVLGKRTWLGFGALMHLGIDVTMNVGTFAEVMIAVYAAWLTGDEVRAAWRWLGRRALRPGEGARPVRRGLLRWLFAPWERLHHRVMDPVTVVHAPGEVAVRRAAILRLFDLGERLRFTERADLGPQDRVVIAQGIEHRDAAAGLALARTFPLLRPLAWLGRLPGCAGAAGRAALRVTA